MEGVSPRCVLRPSYWLGAGIHLHLWLHQGVCSYHTFPALKPSRYREVLKTKGVFQDRGCDVLFSFPSRPASQCQGRQQGLPAPAPLQEALAEVQTEKAAGFTHRLRRAATRRALDETFWLHFLTAPLMDKDSNIFGSVPTSVHYDLLPTPPEPACNKSTLATLHPDHPIRWTFSHSVSILAQDLAEASGPLSPAPGGPWRPASVVRGMCEATGGVEGGCHTAAIFLC